MKVERNREHKQPDAGAINWQGASVEEIEAWRDRRRLRKWRAFEFTMIGELRERFGPTMADAEEAWHLTAERLSYPARRQMPGFERPTLDEITRQMQSELAAAFALPVGEVSERMREFAATLTVEMAERTTSIVRDNSIATMGPEGLDRYAELYELTRRIDESDEELRERMLAMLRGEASAIVLGQQEFSDEEIAESGAARHEETRRILEAGDRQGWWGDAFDTPPPGVRFQGTPRTIVHQMPNGPAIVEHAPEFEAPIRPYPGTFGARIEEIVDEEVQRNTLPPEAARDMGHLYVEERMIPCPECQGSKLIDVDLLGVMAACHACDAEGRVRAPNYVGPDE